MVVGGGRFLFGGQMLDQDTRDFLDDILEFIGTDTLTDEESDEAELANQEYDVTTYALLKGILEARESASDMLYRLAFYFLSKGVSVATVNTSEPLDGEAPKTATSNILIGISLFD